MKNYNIYTKPESIRHKCAPSRNESRDESDNRYMRENDLTLENSISYDCGYMHNRMGFVTAFERKE